MSEVIEKWLQGQELNLRRQGYEPRLNTHSPCDNSMQLVAVDSRNVVCGPLSFRAIGSRYKEYILETSFSNPYFFVFLL